MTKEEKQLLLIDLCGRLPHEVIVDYKENEFETPHWKIKTIYPETLDGWIGYDRRVGAGSESGSRPFKIGEVKPYLRPMSSMTEGEEKELSMIVNGYGTVITNYNRKEFFLWLYSGDKDLPFPILTTFLNWLNEHHFDYNYLIDMGLALEAPEGMYKTE